MVCETMLTGLVTTYPITNCAQQITFSSQLGYTFVTPSPYVSTVLPSGVAGNMSGSYNQSTSPLNQTSTPFNESAPFNHTIAARQIDLNSTASNDTLEAANLTSAGSLPADIIPTPASPSVTTITPPPELITQTTYYLAPWTDLTAGTAPSDVTKEICESFSSYTSDHSSLCSTEYELWETTLVSSIAVSTVSLNISTIIQGPSAVIVWENVVANVTESLTTFSMSTTVATSWATNWVSTNVQNASVSTEPTVYLTSTVDYASSSADAG
jgi:hypothetical protein